MLQSSARTLAGLAIFGQSGFDRFSLMWYRYSSMMASVRKVSLFLIVGLSAFLFRLPSSFAAKVTDLRFWSATDHARLVVDLTESIQFESSSQESPPDTVVLLKGTSLQTRKRDLELKDPFLSRITLAEAGPDQVRLVLHQKRHLNVNVFVLKPYQDKPHRLVVDLVDIAQERKEEEERKKQKEIRPKSKIVVIDPGHGGEDPGAVGPSKTAEKDIVLKVGDKLVNLLNQNNGIRAFLTRKGDYFIPLPVRVKMARDYRADLFVSLHTDGSFNPQARGSSVYCLSLSGATDQAARILADKENMSDILGGAFLTPGSMSKDPDVNQILLDLMQTNSMKESFRFAELVLDEIKGIHRLKYPAYRQASFVVLKAPDIPSALVETAFITNKEDERLLNRPEFQEKLAKTLSSTITKFFHP
jgi:N-acetylmuramoyl-L-alanine amidase